MPVPPECIERHAKRQFVLREKRSEVRFVNDGQHEVEVITVDGCAIIDDIRCDYLVNVAATDVSVFVELKGSDIRHAIAQLTRSHQALTAVLLPQVFWIVCSRRCPLASTEIDKHRRQVRAQMGATLIVRNSPASHVI